MPARNRILLVEDNTILRRNIERFLNTQGYAVTAVPDCTRAHQALKSHSPDLAIFDLRLPDGLGLELISALPDTPPAPVIMMSASANPDWEQRAITLGAAAFLTKPFPLEILMKVICCVIRGGRCLPACKRTDGCPITDPGLNAAVAQEAPVTACSAKLIK